jgi:3-deoxy-7-phosphoheptulonate synthase
MLYLASMLDSTTEKATASKTPKSAVRPSNVVHIGKVPVGKDFTVFAGPCSLETESLFYEIASSVKQSNAVGLRGGMWKLRTSPDAFQGLGDDAFSLVQSVKQKTGMPFVSEVTDPRQIESLAEVVDCFQVGSRNMYNYALLKELGQTKKAVLLKRAFSAKVDEWIKAAEYILAGGNDQIILCERGIRTFETVTRNTFDLNAVAWIKANTPFPVIADPSHGTGVRSLVRPMALAAAAAGADGLLIEVHPDPANAKSDGYQTLNLSEFSNLMVQLEGLLNSLDRQLLKM